MKKIQIVGIASLLSMAAGSVNAAALSYVLDMTNSDFLASGAYNYAKVTIRDGGDAATLGDVDFMVEVSASEFAAAGARPGSKLTLKTFSFNYDNSLTIDQDINIAKFNPEGWFVKKTDSNTGGDFGFFDFELTDKRSKTATPVLSFSITGVDDDSISSYTLGNAEDAYFAAHISGYKISGETSAKFATVAVVPVPAAAWLFGSGLLGLVGVARRRA